MATDTASNPDAEKTSEIKSPDLPIGAYILNFFVSCYLSILPASIIAYIFLFVIVPAIQMQPWLLVLASVVVLVISYFILLLAAWGCTKVGIHVICKGRTFVEGTFSTDTNVLEYRDFSMRHVARKFSMWLFQKHVPRWLYRKYVGSFIKLGKHVELPEWTAMEGAEVGDNTVFARQTFLSSHYINGKTITIKKVVVGNNCIIDSEDETRRAGVGPGDIAEDNVIIRPGTWIPKDTVLQEGGIYQGDGFVERVGNVQDLAAKDIDDLRKAVRKKNKIKSRMVDEWASFYSRFPRIVLVICNVFGLVIGGGIIAAFTFLAMPALIAALGIFGHVLNIILFPALLFLAYGVHLYIPMPVFFAGIKHYQKKLPVLADDQESLEITDPAMIETWKCCKWLKWQAIDRVNRSLFCDTSMIIYQRIGKNNVAFKTVLYVAKIDTDNVSIGDNTLLSFDCHVYAYELTDNPLKLVLKRTSIGSNCVLAASIIKAGARIGNDVVLAGHTVVPGDANLEDGKLYAGNPAMEWSAFKEMRKHLKNNVESME
ncbi:MAG TPA: hypothetical protein VKM55_10760 [Candidatus Lokiarchaeia archaeon]|nr:hypothetical protein [Candidatus Lokiarchaeia archaeon]